MFRFAVQMHILSKSLGKSEEVLEKEINRPRYFSPQDAIGFGIIDRVRLQNSCGSSCMSPIKQTVLPKYRFE